MTSGVFLLLVILLGVLCGLRTFTPLAVIAVAAHVGCISLTATPFAFLATTAGMVITVLLALGELFTDKLPKTPSRLSPLGLIGRMCLGAMTAVAFAFAYHHAVFFPLILGIIGSLLGSFLGHRFRSGLVRALKSRDLPVALLEDAICILGSILLVTRT